MALPSTGYDTATVTNPGSALTNFTLMVDLSKASASWWAVVDTADGTKGRAAKSDGTELATDWIAFDNGAKTGWLRVKWTGTLAASGSQVLRIYPPNTANSSNAANATYGSDNAYDANWKGYWPAGGGTDRTSNGNTANPVSAGNPTVGGATGKVGAGTTYDGSNDYCAAGAVCDGSSNVTMLGWLYLTGGANDVPMSKYADFDNIAYLYRHQAAASLDLRVETSNVQAFSEYEITTSTWQHVAGVFVGGTSLTAYRGGSATGTPDTTGVPSAFPTTTNLLLGSLDGTSTYNWAGVLNEMQIHSAARSAAWIAEEYAQTNNNATFWGTWTWNAPAGGIPVVMHHRRMMGVS